ncbi:MAG: hypothetical protein JWQ25_2934, partial [Daejeonella sp.]|nr:hypothetical protein [Daejeonella sp.]
MKKLYFIITLLFVLPFIVKAQNQVKGTVKDDAGQAVIAANVFVLNSKDSTVLKGTKTDLSGHYDFKGIPGGKFILSVSMIGFKKSYTKIDLQSPILNVPSIVLQRDSKVLDQVVIKAKKPLFEQKLDRTIINVQSSIASSGGTALEVLEKAPGVVVDRQNNSISMNGKDGVVVMINGKINHMPLSAVVQMLAGMNSSNIQTIELITNPPANFDAEGNAGYINIKLKNNPNAGTNGSYTLTAGYGNGFSPDGSLNFNHRNNKINFYGDYSFSTTPLDQQFNLYRKVSRETSVIENLTQSQRQATDRNHNGKLGLDFQLDSNTVIGALVSGYDNKWSMDAVNANSIMINNAVDTSINIANDEINQWKHQMANVNFQHTFLGTSKAKITADIDYLYYRDNNPNNYINSYFNKTGDFLYDQKTKSDKVTPIKVWVAKTDYTRKLGKSIDLESGLKSTISRFNNDVSINRFVQDVWNYDQSLSNSYDLKEKISAIYNSLSYGINEKTSVKVGFRYEYTVSNLNSATQKNIVDRQYGTLFPSIFISRKLNADQSINLAYNKRIT